MDKVAKAMTGASLILKEPICRKCKEGSRQYAGPDESKSSIVRQYQGKHDEDFGGNDKLPKRVDHRSWNAERAL